MAFDAMIDSVFRDFAIPGLPASGGHFPVKSEIRSLLKEMAFVAPALDPVRNFGTMTAPYRGDASWIDNVLGIQNKSVGDIGFGLVRGNAAINFLDSLDIERAALGYSRNSAHAPNSGYYPDIFYIEVGNPFTTDAQASSFRLIVTHKVGGPYWGGAAVSYFPISLDSTNGDLRFNTNGGIGGGVIGFDDATFFGSLGAPEIVGFGMTSTLARLREHGTANYFTLTTNYQDPQNGPPISPTPDNVALSIWEVGLGAGRDYFSVERYPAGINQTPANVFRASLAGFMIGQTDLTAYADGRLAVTAGAGKTAITAKSTAGDAFPTMMVWNNATANNNILISFLTETSATVRGAIAFNRAAGQVAYNTTSDYRSKDSKGLLDLASATDLVRSIDIHIARMKGGATADFHAVMADQLQSVVPYAVTGTKDAVDEGGDPIMQGVDYSKVVPLIIASLQDAHGRIDELAAA